MSLKPPGSPVARSPAISTEATGSPNPPRRPSARRSRRRGTSPAPRRASCAPGAAEPWPSWWTRNRPPSSATRPSRAWWLASATPWPHGTCRWWCCWRAMPSRLGGPSSSSAAALWNSTHGTLEKILDQEIPVVNCGYPRTMAERVSYVMGDEAMGGRLMAEHLRERGARRMGVIAGPADSPGGTLRLDAFRRAASGLLPDPNVRFGDYTREAGQRFAAELLDADPGIDAIFAASDVMAAGVLDTATERDAAVPGQLLVGGFDDSLVATSVEPALTTIRQPFDRISTELVSVLLREISDGYRSAVTVPVELVTREST